jgi:serralysin
MTMTRSRSLVFVLVTVVFAGAPSAGLARAGALDTTFSRDGKVMTNFTRVADEAHGLALQANGKIVAAGEANGGRVFRGTRFALARYNRNGTLDTTFGGDGKVSTKFSGGDDIAFDVVIQSDGRIVAAGSLNYSRFALARYNANGSLDTSFGGDGKVTTDVTGEIDMIFSVAVQPADGRIVVAGLAGGQVGNRFALARYNTDGTLDSSFGGDGKVTTNITRWADEADEVIIQSDGKIVAGGTANSFCCDSKFALVRYNTDGTLDVSFGGDGRVTTDFTSGFHGADRLGAVGVQANGKIVAAGQAGDQEAAGGGRLALVRYNADGTRDVSFGGNGKVRTNFTPAVDYADSLAVQANGKIVTGGGANLFVGGSGRLARDWKFALARYNANGTLDARFSGDGKTITNFTRGPDLGAEIAIQPDGRIVAGGRGGGRFALARYRGT